MFFRFILTIISVIFYLKKKNEFVYDYKESIINEIIKFGYTPYIIKDMGKEKALQD